MIILVHKWLETFLGHIDTHQATLDAQQETIISDETELIQKDRKTTEQVICAAFMLQVPVHNLHI